MTASTKHLKVSAANIALVAISLLMAYVLAEGYLLYRAGYAHGATAPTWKIPQRNVS